MPSQTKIWALAQNDKITPDKAQLKAIDYLEKIILELSQEAIQGNKNQVSDIEIKGKKTEDSNKYKKSIFSFLSGRKKIKPQKAATQNSAQSTSQSTSISIKGMYIWGKVGRGKTWLMDLFYKSLTIEKIQRIHFHEFMLLVHKQLQDLPSQADPLDTIGKAMSRQYRLICLDEFHVMDIADAVILHGLLKSLFENGVVVVTTSNREPDDLYQNGSHRERFLPAIELIKQNMHVFYLDADTDYRKQGTIFQDVFFIPHNAETQQKLELSFIKYAASEEYSMQAIKIYGREIPVVRVINHSIWFTFDILCRGARSSSDYLQIAKEYSLVIVSQIPVLHEGEEGPARRFLNLIDAFYDQHVHLILSSNIIIEEMYQGDLLQFEFERAQSRLHEMQSHIWWKKFRLQQ